MDKKDLKRVQEIDTELLLMVDAICKKHHLQYMLFFGSLIGAVRHGGPIPWDDDIDIAMTRSNYERFAQVLPNEIDHKLYNIKFMGSGSIDYVTEIKIGKVGTTFCMPGTETIDIMNQVQLDVFCFEPMKPMSQKQYAFYKKIWKVMNICRLNSSEKTLLKYCVDNGNRNLKSVYKIGLNCLHLIRALVGERQIEKLGYKMFVDKTGKSALLTIIQANVVVDKKWVEHTQLLDYAGYRIPVPIDYDACLKSSYGDYMKLPPEEHRYRKNFDIWVFKENKK